ncbi:Transient receptor potential channel Flc/Pkd2-like protein [Abortiporus biennis]
MPGRYGCCTFSLHLFQMFILCFLLLLSCFQCTLAQPANLTFSDCFSGNSSLKLNISNVYAQMHKHDGGALLNFTLLGQNPLPIVAASNDSQPVATTLFTTTEMLTFEVQNLNSFFCSNVRPPSPLPAPNDQGTYCPLPAGPFALTSSVELGKGFELATFYTRLRALDPFQNELLCIDVDATPLEPGAVDSPYGHAHLIFWVTVCLAIAYWLVVGIARLVSAWGRGATRSGPGVWARIESAGFILASAISGERFATSPALMRFCTPSLRDIIFHTQWCAALSMVAVQWPDFVYPILSQTAWSMLSYNITISQGADASSSHWNPLAVDPYNPPSNFADQLNDTTSPIHMDPTEPNLLFQLPKNATDGISSYAYAVGLMPRDLFGICLSIFLAINAATIVISVAVWLLDWVACRLFGGATVRSTPGINGSRSPRYSAGSKDMLDAITQLQATDENRSSNGHFLFRTTSRFASGRPWWRLQSSSFVSLHGSVLQGNLVRILILFHLPVTIFSCYQFTLSRESASLASIILAVLSFAVFSVLLPIFLIVRLTFTNTTKLYDETWTLLFLGPLYNHYRHGSQLFACLLFATNIAFGVTIGCGQRNGTVQAIIILVVEVMSALGTSIWLPWGQGASMGLISFLFCVARIVISVLLVILTPIVSVGNGAAQWVAYAILFILGLVYFAFFMMLFVKLIEALVRIIGGVGFHRSRHVVDSGLLGAMGLVGCCGSRKPQRGRYEPDDSQPSTLPLSRPSIPYKDVTPTPSGPPSVLKPEHALQPYKEDSDDETGYIMGAWQPFPRPGYSHVDDHASSSVVTPGSETPKTGFARVGGGRAHYDSPYAITSSGSTQTFPSSERNNYSYERNAPGSSSLHNEYSRPPTPSVVGDVAKKADFNSLPPGAMPPSHIRTKSQTAIIEDASALAALQAAANSRPNQASASSSAPLPQSADITANDEAPKKKWYNLRKSRKSIDGSEALDVPAVPPPPPAEPPTEPGRSFVVVRKQRPGTGNSKNSSPEQQQSDPPRSFAVLRGKNQDSAS